MINLHPNCTLPPEGSKYVSAPSVRGTLDIVWSCAAIVVICTWSVQRPNIPFQITPETKRQWMRLKTKRVWDKTFMMLIGFLFPEWGSAIAISEWWSAHQLSKQMLHLADVDYVPWSKTHAFFANMGGFVVRFDHLIAEANSEQSEHNLPRSIDSLPRLPSSRNSEVDIPLQPVSPTRTSRIEVPSTSTASGDASPPPREQGTAHGITIDGSDHFVDVVTIAREDAETGCRRWLSNQTLKYGHTDWDIDPHNAQLVKKVLDTIGEAHLDGGNMDVKDWCSALRFYQANIWYLDGPQLIYAREQGIIDKLPRITEEEVSDRSKSNPLVSLIAIFQVLWLVTQLITRAVKGTSPSLLEISTLALAICTFVIYLLLWNKPHDVSTTISIPASRYPTTEEVKQMTYLAYWTSAISPHSKSEPGIRWLPKYNIHGSFDFVSVPCMAIVASVFGCLHCIAWNLDFPTHAEQILWRVSALILAGLPMLALLTEYLDSDQGLSTAYLVLFIPVCVLYIAARCFIVVESLRSLAFLPPHTFLTTWASQLPTIS